MGSIQLPDTSTVATVDLARLLAQDGAEVEKLTQAMEGPGYFYLDFRNDPSTQKVVDQARVIYAASDSYFEQPAETKAKDARVGLPDWSDRGYGSRCH